MAHRPTFTTTLWLFGVAKFIIATAMRFVYAFLPALARGLGVSVESFGTLVSVRWIAGAATPAVVAVSGREDRRRIGVVGLALFVVGSLATAVSGVYAGAMVGFALAGIGTFVFNAAMQASVADRVPYERRGRVLGLLESTWSLSFLVGAPIAGWLITASGWAAPFWATGIGIAVIAPPLIMGMEAGSVGGAADGVIRWDKSTLGFIAATVALVGSVEVVFISYATWLETAHSLGVEGLALVAVGIGMGELVAEGAVVAVADRVGKRRAVIAGMLLSAVAYLVLATDPARGAAIIALVAGVTGFEFALVSSIPLGTELQPQARITFLSRFYVAQSAGRALAAIGGLVVFRTWAITGVGLVAALVAAAGALVMVFAVREQPVSAAVEA